MNISFHVVLTRLTFVFKLYWQAHLLSSCLGKVTICFQVVVCKLLHVVFTSCYNVLQVHVSTHFGNDVAARLEMT